MKTKVILVKAKNSNLFVKKNSECALSQPKIFPNIKNDSTYLIAARIQEKYRKYFSHILVFYVYYLQLNNKINNLIKCFNLQIILKVIYNYT